jgi:hypothetical protein
VPPPPQHTHTQGGGGGTLLLSGLACVADTCANSTCDRSMLFIRLELQAPLFGQGHRKGFVAGDAVFLVHWLYIGSLH